MSFPHIDNTPIEQLFTHEKTLTFTKGNVVIHAGDDPHFVYHLDRGFVKAYSITDQGLYNIVVIHVKNQLFPLLSLVGHAPPNLFYEAMDDVAVRRIAKRRVVDQINREPALAQAVLQQAMDMLRNYGDHIENLELRTARERVVKQLLSLATQFGLELRNGATAILVPIVHQDLADAVNASRETVSRILSSLTRGGIIGMQGHSLLIRNHAALARIVDRDADMDTQLSTTASAW